MIKRRRRGNIRKIRSFAVGMLKIAILLLEAPRRFLLLFFFLLSNDTLTSREFTRCILADGIARISSRRRGGFNGSPYSARRDARFHGLREPPP